jgi:2-methylcitrate dehydratase PrpD
MVAALIGLRLPESVPLAAIGDGGEHALVRRLVAAIRATEIDDIHISGCVTAGAIVVPTALVTAARVQADGDALLAGIAAGYRTAIAFAGAFGGASILYRGIWPTYLAAPVAAAATAASIRGLDAAARARALRLAIARTNSVLDRSAPRWLALGCAAVDGLVAADAAAAGLDAGDTAVQRWAEQAGVSLDATVLERAVALDTIDCKTFPTSRQGYAAIETFRSLRRVHPDRPVARIAVAVPMQYLAMVGSTGRPRSRIESMTAVAWQMALAEHAPDALYDVARHNIPQDPALDGFAARVTVAADARLTELYPEFWAGKVRIEYADGGSIEAEDLSPAGSKALGWPELIAKAGRLASANGIAAERIARLLAQARVAGRSQPVALRDWIEAADLEAAPPL